MSVQSEINRLNAVKERIRTNLVAQGITVPADTMLDAMAEQILSVAGQRGTGILNTTTGIAAYTTAVGGVSPKYRILLSTLKTQAKVNEVLVGDTVRYSTFIYPVIYVDESYAYMGTRISLQGSAGSSITVKSVTESTESGGSNVVTFSDNETVTIKNGKDGAKGDPGNDYVLTESDKSEIMAMVIESLGGNPIFGVVDENNNIIVSGNLPDGTYSVKYEMEDGSKVNIGDLVLDTNVYYTVTNNLTNCTSNNSATQAVGRQSYSATITAKSGYELKTVTVTMGGSPVSASGGVINIANVTGNIVITAVAEVSGPAYTNQIPISTDASGNPYNGGQGWKTGYRLNSSGAEVELSGVEVTGFIPFRLNDTLYLKNITDDGSHNIALYDASYAKLATMTFTTPFGGAVNGNYVYKKFTPTLHTQIEQAGDNIRFLRLCANEITANSIITVNEAIT